MELLSKEKIPILRLIWAKSNPYHPLILHLIDTGEILRALYSSKAFLPVKKRLTNLMGFNTTEDCTSWLCYIAALHDIGKCSPDFQCKQYELKVRLEDLKLYFRQIALENYFHSVFSGEWVFDRLLEDNWHRKSANLVRLVLKGHHGLFSGKYWPEEGIISEDWEPIRQEINSILLNIFNPPKWVKDKPFREINAIGILVLGSLVISDWIASNADLFINKISDSEHEFSPRSLQDYSERSLKLARECVNTLGFNQIINWKSVESFRDIWPSFTSLFPIQQIIEEEIHKLQVKNSFNSYKFYIIEATMGEGKTEAALYLSTQLIRQGDVSGFYIALPTTATSNQMYGRAKKFLESFDRNVKSIKLVHGTSWMIDELTQDIDSLIMDDEQDIRTMYEWFKPSRRGLLSNYAVGTIDQALLSVLNVKFGFLRLLGLSNKILIIDEVHAYDSYTNYILQRLLAWAHSLEVPVILLSATLPSRKKVDLINAYSNCQIDIKHVDPSSSDPNSSNYPLITMISKDGDIKLVSIKDKSQPVNQKTYGIILKWFANNELSNLAEEVIESANKQCVCVILNTVTKCQDLYAEIKSNLEKTANSTTVMLFHARFPVRDRFKIEEIVLRSFGKESSDCNERPESAILIATQVVEQSLDLDFDEMYSEIAPVDLLIQRMGRLHRHQRKNRYSNDQPVFHVFGIGRNQNDFGSTELVYSKYILYKTLHVLRNMRQIRMPRDIRPVIEEVYTNPLSTEDIRKLNIDPEEFQVIHDEWNAENEKEKNLAGTYLTPSPKGSSFSYATFRETIFRETDGPARSYLHARTRIGDSTETLILVKNNEYSAELSKKRSPGKSLIKELMLKSVRIPEYWIDNAVPRNGHHQIEQSQRWLLNHKVLRMQTDSNTCFWEGVDQYGRNITIIYDREIGLKLIKN